jgi:hypothetical protein
MNAPGAKQKFKLKHGPNVCALRKTIGGFRFGALNEPVYAGVSASGIEITASAGLG